MAGLPSQLDPTATEKQSLYTDRIIQTQLPRLNPKETGSHHNERQSARPPTASASTMYYNCIVQWH